MKSEINVPDHLAEALDFMAECDGQTPDEYIQELGNSLPAGLALPHQGPRSRSHTVHLRALRRSQSGHNLRHRGRNPRAALADPAVFRMSGGSVRKTWSLTGSHRFAVGPGQ